MNDDASRIKFLAPFMHNHMVSAEVRHATCDTDKDAAESVNSVITTAKIMVRGVQSRAGVETSPGRQ